MSNCEHKHTGSCSPAGVYLYVKCMDCGAILNESEDGRRLRAGCPGFKAERYASGSCEHCHHDAQYHYDFLRSRLAEAEALLRGIRYNFYMAQHWADRIDAHLARKP